MTGERFITEALTGLFNGRKMKNSILLFLIIHFIGCTKLVLLKEDIRQPALEDYSSLSNFLIKKQIDTTELLCFKDSSSLHSFFRKGIKIPDARFFNQSQQMVDYRESPEDCNGMVAVFLEKAEMIRQQPPVPGQQLGQYTTDLVYVRNQQPFQLEAEQYDLYLAIYWAKYLGNVNKHKVFDWLTLVEDAQKRGLKIRVIKVNADYQKAWGLKKEDLPHFKF